MGTTLDSVIIQPCLLQDCFQVLKEWCKPGSLAATPVHAELTRCSLALLSLGSWFRLCGMASTSPQGQAPKGCLAAVLQASCPWEMSLLPSILLGLFFFFLLGFECEGIRVELVFLFGLCSCECRTDLSGRTLNISIAGTKAVHLLVTDGSHVDAWIAHFHLQLLISSSYE